MSASKRHRIRLRKAGTTVLLSLLLPAVLAVAAYVINVVYMEVARTELQITTDVATRAAGRTLAVTGSKEEALAAAERMMKLNPFANKSLTLNASNIVFGASTRLSETQRYSFTPSNNANAVSVAANGKIQIPMLFPTMGVPVDFRPIKSAISTQTELDIALVIDRSGSMAYGDFEIAGSGKPLLAPLGWTFGMPILFPSRWTEAVSAVNSFLTLLSTSSHDEHVALVSYSDQAKREVDLTGAFASTQLALAAITNKFDGGSTNIGDGILAAAAALSDKSKARPWATRVMIVLTDGIWTSGPDPVLAAKSAASQQILIYTITFSGEADQARMSEIAAIGMGKHFHAATGSELTEAFKDIARSLPTLLTY